jgi:hypothetical protein
VIAGVESQLSVAVALPVLAGDVLAEHSIVIFGGHVIIGAWLSSTEMICSHVLLLLQSSVAIQVLVIVLSCGQDPLIVTSLNVKVGVTSQLSVAVALPVLAGKVLSVHSIVIFPGQIITGGTLSPSTMMN